jgi:hypothetical protein
VAEVEFGKFIHAVIVLASLQHEGQQHGVVDRPHIDAEAAEDRHVVLDVLPDLEDGAVFQQVFEQFQSGRHVDLLRLVP